MNKQERFKAAYDYLIWKHVIEKQEDLAKKMRSTQANVSLALNGTERVLTDRFIRRFSACFPGLFNVEWLLHEEGKMLREEMEQPASSTETANAEDRIVEVYAFVIKTYEERIRNLSALIEENRRINAEITAMRDDLKATIKEVRDLAASLHKPYYYNQQPDGILLAAENKD